ncbi:MAG TPA: class I SAM-dependent methyltransferase [Acidobacteriota bacterium]|nr:class I SAM-dependent methyltransferase [Acidobacteriota bacterium]
MEQREYETLYGVEAEHWWYRALHKSILHALTRAFSDQSKIRVLDAGCGTGLLLQKIRQDAIGIDYSQHAVKFCAQRGLKNISRASVETLPFSDQSFDAIISADVLYHKNVASDHQALKQFHRVLKPDGVIILNLPAFEFLRSSHDRAIHTQRRYTKSQLRTIIESAGFKVEKLYYRNSLLFPVVALIRLLRKGKEESESDVVLPSKLVNAILTKVLFLDDWLARKIPFPAGISLFCAARRV